MEKLVSMGGRSGQSIIKSLSHVCCLVLNDIEQRRLLYEWLLSVGLWRAGLSIFCLKDENTSLNYHHFAIQHHLRLNVLRLTWLGGQISRLFKSFAHERGWSQTKVEHISPSPKYNFMENHPSMFIGSFFWRSSFGLFVTLCNTSMMSPRVKKDIARLLCSFFSKSYYSAEYYQSQV